MFFATSEVPAPAPSSAPPVPRAPRVVALAALATLALLALDVGSKLWAEHALSEGRLGAAPALCDDAQGPRQPQRLSRAPMPVWDHVVTLDYAENCSAAMGLARQLPAPSRRYVLAGLAALAALALFVALARGHGSRAFAWGVPFVAAGALGNMVDRLRVGYVVDFLHVQYAPWSFDYPVFNVADVLIAIGVALLVVGASRAPAPDVQGDALS